MTEWLFCWGSRLHASVCVRERDLVHRVAYVVDVQFQAVLGQVIFKADILRSEGQYIVYHVALGYQVLLD